VEIVVEAPSHCSSVREFHDFGSGTIYSLPTARVSSEVAHEVLLRLEAFTQGAIPKGWVEEGADPAWGLLV
jgi:hypothetical protein